MRKLAGLFVAVALLSPAFAQVAISQVYGGGGNSGATYTNDFIEIFNRGAAPVSLAGWSVQYASATGAFGSASLTTALTNVTLQPGQYYLIQEAAGAGGTTVLPTPDVSGSIAMSATAGKVRLVDGSAAVVDLIGYGPTANAFEGSPAPILSNTTAAIRANAGCQDTNDNSVDFATGAPAPRNTGSGLNTCSGPPTISLSSVSQLEGNLGPTVFVFTVSLSAPATATVSFVANTQAGGLNAATPGVDYLALVNAPGSIAAGQQQTQIVVQVNGDLGPEVDETFELVISGVTNATPSSVTALGTILSDDLCDAPGATLISSIQGAGLASPLVNSIVDVQAIVVGAFQGTSQLRGFYLQEEDFDADGSPATSEGLFVFDNNFGVSVAPGDKVRVRGRVVEFSNLTELSNVTHVIHCGSGHTVTPATIHLPMTSLNDWERYEGMAVTFDQPLTATGNFGLERFGEVDLAAGRLFNPTHTATPGAAAIAQKDLNDRSRIVLDDASNTQNLYPTLYPQGGLSAANTLRTGATISGSPDSLTPVMGIVDQAFGRYALRPAQPYYFISANPRAPVPVVPGRIKVAAFNVLNYFVTLNSRGANSAEEFARQRTKIIAAINALNADVVGLIEIQNDASASIFDLVQGLNAAAGSNKWTFVNTGAFGTDEIKTAFLYQPLRVQTVGSHAILDIGDSLNRPALAQDFAPKGSTWPGERFTVVVNHFKSKGSDCDAVGDPDTGDGQGNCNLTRLHMAQALSAWLAGNPTANPAPAWDRNVLIIGDLNSYKKEDPIQHLKANGFTDLIETYAGANAYSYQFSGESGYLDHGLANGSLKRRVQGAADWHINADEPIALDYNTEFKGTGNGMSAQAQLAYYAPDAFRSSDHDPLLVGLNPLLGDFDDDGELDAKDRTALLAARGKQNFDPRMDMDGDGAVTQEDFHLWQEYFQSWKQGRYR